MIIRLFFLLSVLGLQSSVFAAFDSNHLGRYQLDVNMGGTHFIDFLEISRNEQGQIVGEYVVPNSFSSELLEVEELDENTLSFVILVTEILPHYRVLVRASFDSLNMPHVQGTLLEIDNNNFEASFTGVKVAI